MENNKMEDEDPEKMIKQMVIELQEAIAKGTSGLSTAMAQEKKLESDYNNYIEQGKGWEQKATVALNAGQEDRARQALAKKADADRYAKQYEQMYLSARDTAGKLKSQVESLKAKLSEAKMKESEIIGRKEAEVQALTELSSDSNKSVAIEKNTADKLTFAKYLNLNQTHFPMENNNFSIIQPIITKYRKMFTSTSFIADEESVLSYNLVPTMKFENYDITFPYIGEVTITNRDILRIFNIFNWRLRRIIIFAKIAKKNGNFTVFIVLLCAFIG